MTIDQTGSQPNGAWPQVRSGPLMIGGILVGVGAVVAFAWRPSRARTCSPPPGPGSRSSETPPSELARLKWEQAKQAAASGAATWRDHPNAKVRLARRTSSG